MSLAHSIIRGSLWMVLARITVRLLGLASTVTLARLLEPEDFGLIAMAMLVIGAVDAASRMSMDVVLIQKQDAQRAHYDTVWSMIILRGLVIAAILLVVAIPAAGWFDEPRVTAILLCLAASTTVAGFNNVGVVDFRKNLQFKKDYTYRVYIKLFGVVATVSAAFMLRSYWALVVGILLTALFTIALSYVMSPYRPRLSLVHWREVFAFSKWLLLNNILGYVQHRTGALVIGAVLGASKLGIFTIAQEIATLASTELLAPLRRALFPGFSKIAHDEELLRRGYLEGMGMMFAVGIPFAAGLGVTAKLLVPLALGNKWLEVVVPLQILSVAGVFQIGTANCGTVLLAKGYPRGLTIANALSAIVGAPIVVYLSLTYGIVGACWGLAIGSGLLSASVLVMSARVVGVAALDVLSAVWRTPVSLAVMVMVVWPLVDPTGLEGPLELALRLASAVAAGALAYVATHLVVWQFCGRPRGAESRLLEFALSALRGLRGFRVRYQ